MTTAATPAAASARAATPPTPVKRFNGKRKGTKAELKCVHLLEAAGYLCTKAGGSLGIFDVLAIGATDVRAIQVKSGTKTLTPLERETIHELKVPPCVSKEYWKFHDGHRVPTIERL